MAAERRTKAHFRHEDPIACFRLAEEKRFRRCFPRIQGERKRIEPIKCVTRWRHVRWRNTAGQHRLQRRACRSGHWTRGRRAIMTNARGGRLRGAVAAGARFIRVAAPKVAMHEAHRHRCYEERERRRRQGAEQSCLTQSHIRTIHHLPCPPQVTVGRHHGYYAAQCQTPQTFLTFFSGFSLLLPKASANSMVPASI